MSSIRCLCLLFCALCFSSNGELNGKVTNEDGYEIPIVAIIPSYKNARWYKNNLDSIFSQDYTNYRVIYIDDVSPDCTYDLVKAYVDEHDLWDRVTLIKNEKRQGAMANLYYAIHSCDDWAIAVTVDGDDWLSDNQVFNKLNEIYHDPNVWLTYGQFKEYPSNIMGFCVDIPKYVVENNSYRKHGMSVSHLRTFYAWLFKEIKQEDLMWNGDFFVMTWDKAMMAPMLEISNGRFKFISDVLYIYNFINPINDCKVDGHLQASLVSVIYGMKPYEPLVNVPEYLAIPEWYAELANA